ncbi:unnamed protein product [Ambrosiozyma monospora]|uniref:Unnamed protein product n=1 Tax=Ambrosiozyma monospora TaxID=43982 RepID=A0ACB5SW92_AMBMO|nr:unnamed protein product [Ambrosiozyma monospora]
MFAVPTNLNEHASGPVPKPKRLSFGGFMTGLINKPSVPVPALPNTVRKQRSHSHLQSYLQSQSQSQSQSHLQQPQRQTQSEIQFLDKKLKPDFESNTKRLSLPFLEMIKKTNSAALSAIETREEKGKVSPSLSSPSSSFSSFSSSSSMSAKQPLISIPEFNSIHQEHQNQYQQHPHTNSDITNSKMASNKDILELITVLKQATSHFTLPEELSAGPANQVIGLLETFEAIHTTGRKESVVSYSDSVCPGTVSNSSTTGAASGSGSGSGCMKDKLRKTVRKVSKKFQNNLIAVSDEQYTDETYVPVSDLSPVSAPLSADIPLPKAKKEATHHEDMGPFTETLPTDFVVSTTELVQFLSTNLILYPADTIRISDLLQSQQNFEHTDESSLLLQQQIIEVVNSFRKLLIRKFDTFASWNYIITHSIGNSRFATFCQKRHSIIQYEDDRKFVDAYKVALIQWNKKARAPDKRATCATFVDGRAFVSSTYGGSNEMMLSRAVTVLRITGDEQRKLNEISAHQSFVSSDGIDYDDFDDVLSNFSFNFGDDFKAANVFKNEDVDSGLVHTVKAFKQPATATSISSHSNNIHEYPSSARVLNPDLIKHVSSSFPSSFPSSGFSRAPTSISSSISSHASDSINFSDNALSSNDSFETPIFSPKIKNQSQSSDFSTSTRSSSPATILMDFKDPFNPNSCTLPPPSEPAPPPPLPAAASTSPRSSCNLNPSNNEPDPVTQKVINNIWLKMFILAQPNYVISNVPKFVHPRDLFHSFCPNASKQTTFENLSHDTQLIFYLGFKKYYEEYFTGHNGPDSDEVKFGYGQLTLEELEYVELRGNVVGACMQFGDRVAADLISGKSI